MVHRGCGRNVEHRVGFIYLLELGLEEATSDEAAKHICGCCVVKGARKCCEVRDADYETNAF